MKSKEGKDAHHHPDSIISDPDESGVRTVTFMFNGAEREIRIQDKSVDMKTVSRRKADPDKAGDIGATLSGSVVNVLVSKGQKVKKGEPLVVTEAMKMETTITSPIDGTVGEIYAVKGRLSSAATACWKYWNKITVYKAIKRCCRMCGSTFFH